MHKSDFIVILLINWPIQDIDAAKERNFQRRFKKLRTYARERDGYAFLSISDAKNHSLVRQYLGREVGR